MLIIQQMDITSYQNPKVKLVQKLHQKRGRLREGRFLIDHLRLLERALDNDYQVDFVLVCPEIAEIDLPDNVTTLTITHDILEKISYRENSSGFVAVMHSKPVKTAVDESAMTSLILGLVNLNKPGNIGALLRTADSTGFDTVFLIDTQLDLYNPNIIRNSTGACFKPHLYFLDSETAYQYFQQQNVTTIAGHLDGTASLYDVEFSSKSAILLGTEETGLDDFWSSHCDQIVKIPMVGDITDSLNVSVSGAIMMYEALRQQLG